MAITLDGTNGITTPSQTTNGDVIIADKIVHLDDTNTAIRFPAADTVTVETSGSERLRIDSSGNLLVGTSSPNPNAKLSVIGFVSSGNQNYSGQFSDGVNSTYYITHQSGLTNLITDTAMAFYSAGTERMRISSSGNLLVGATTEDAKFNVVSSEDAAYIETSGSTSTCSYFKVPGTTAYYALFQNSSGTNIGSIRTTDGTTVRYNTSSDYRLKENVVPMTGALARVASLKPCTYTWKSTGQAGQGFIAHELQAVVPECVSGEKDAVDANGNPQYQGIDTSFLVATLVKAVQEQQVIITALTARITALETTQ